MKCMHGRESVLRRNIGVEWKWKDDGLWWSLEEGWRRWRCCFIFYFLENKMKESPLNEGTLMIFVVPLLCPFTTSRRGIRRKADVASYSFLLQPLWLCYKSFPIQKHDSIAGMGLITERPKLPLTFFPLFPFFFLCVVFFLLFCCFFPFFLLN